MKKFLALILSFVCIFALAFTACGDKSGDNTDETNKEQPGDKEENPGGSDEQGDPEQHTHTYETSWSYDKNNHWHKATCHPEEISDKAYHEYSGGTCIVCNMTEPGSYSVGDKFLDFTVQTFNSSDPEGTFSSADARGKVIVINFWYVNCGPCVDEMPEIETVKNTFGDKVEILALHATSRNYKDDLEIAPIFIENKGWSNYNTIFGKDNENDYLYDKVSGAVDHPVTVVLNGEGIITSIVNGTMFPYKGWTLDKEDKLSPLIRAALKS